MKARAKQVLKSLVVRLPWGARMAIAEALKSHDSDDYSEFARLAAKANVVTIIVDGEYGLIGSAASDRIILPIYSRTGTWAGRTNDELASFFAGGPGTYLDIGANVGLTTIPLARKSQVRCIAFEPDPVNFRNLQENIRRNAPESRTELHQLALFSSEGELDFGLAEDGNTGDHRIINQAHAKRRTIRVKALPLDAVVQEFNGPLAAKIDVQGAEAAVISGGSRVLNQADFVILEFSPYHIAQLGGDYKAITNFLRGFERVALLPGESNDALKYAPATEASDALDAFYKAVVHDEYKFMDVYARRGERR